MVRFPRISRHGNLAVFGSATLAVSQRIGPGSTFTSEDIDTSRDDVKAFAFKGNLRGSWFVDGAMTGTQFYSALANGTFPAGPGSVRVASTQEAYRRMRARVRMSAVGSASVFYGGQGRPS